jgi:hypothetical protein
MATAHMLRRLSIHLLLACFLLLTQQLALAHGSSHALKGSPTESQSCHTCLMSAQIGGPLTVCSPDFGTDLRCALQAAPARSVFVPAPLRAFESRAPPRNS